MTAQDGTAAAMEGVDGSLAAPSSDLQTNLSGLKHSLSQALGKFAGTAEIPKITRRKTSE
jgi:hypothetical protein